MSIAIWGVNLGAIYERLIFQALTYNPEEYVYNKHFIPTLLITTSKFVGPTKLLICGNTVQVNDYEETFLVHLDQAKQLGKKLIKE